MTTSADDLIGAFGAEFGVAVTDENRFGSVSLGWLGVCDGSEGVQWNTGFIALRTPPTLP